MCVGKLIIIGSDNGLSPDRRQAIIWTNAGLLSIGPLRTYFSENLIKIQQFSLTKMHVKMTSAKWRPSFLGVNVLRWDDRETILSTIVTHPPRNTVCILKRDLELRSTKIRSMYGIALYWTLFRKHRCWSNYCQERWLFNLRAYIIQWNCEHLLFGYA